MSLIAIAVQLDCYKGCGSDGGGGSAHSKAFVPLNELNNKRRDERERGSRVMRGRDRKKGSNK